MYFLNVVFSFGFVDILNGELLVVEIFVFIKVRFFSN